MDVWWRAAGNPIMERIANYRIRLTIEVNCMVVDDIREKQLIWFMDVHRLPGERLL